MRPRSFSSSAPRRASTSAAAAVGDPPDFGSVRRSRRLATWLLLRNLTHGPDIDAALDLLAHAKTSNVTMHALALHVVGVMLASTDRRAAVDYQRAAVDLSGAIGSALVHGFALDALAVAEAEDDPAEGVRRYADMLTHYLRVGNRTHLREFARGSVIPLVDCQQWEAAATVEGATRASAHFLPTLGEPIGRAVSRARDMIGDEFDVAAVSRRSDDRRGARRLREHGGRRAVIAGAAARWNAAPFPSSSWRRTVTNIHRQARAGLMDVGRRMSSGAGEMLLLGERRRRMVWDAESAAGAGSRLDNR